MTARELERKARKLPPTTMEGTPGDPVDLVERLGLVYDPEWQHVYSYPKAGGDGADVRVFVARWPAMFWRIECPEKGIRLSTGSGMHDLVHRIATAVSQGMLGGGTKG